MCIFRLPPRRAIAKMSVKGMDKYYRKDILRASVFEDEIIEKVESF